MFCSKECKAKDTFHPIPCRQGHLDHNLNCILRMKQKAAQIAGSNQQLFDIMEEGRRANKTVFDFDLSDGEDPEYKRNLLRAVSMLARTMSNAGNCIKNFPQRQLLEGTTVDTPKERAQMLEVIRDLFVFYSTNAYTLEENDRSTCYLTEENIGAGLFAFLSLLNHSCLPNMAMITVDNKCVLITTRPVKAGEQVRSSEAHSSDSLDSGC